MGRIHLLDPGVRDQIAAGEVVERPQSVVKELIENSLDAGATRIEIELAAGGTAEIAVRDNGDGIDAEDIPLAVKRHATSKLTVIEDLDAGVWLGFRGEALAAIAAVSRLSLASRTGKEPVGTRIEVDAGTLGPIVAQAMDVGTTVKVHDLFYPVPARLKMLRSSAAELGAIHRLVTAMAVGFPDVAFRLKADGRVLLASSGRGNPMEVLSGEVGGEIARDLMPIEAEEDGWKVIGHIGPAHRHRASRHGQALFLNRRLIQNWVLRQAVEEAFRPEVPLRHFPLFWLRISIDPATVDPNAHPGKLEVRIQRERALAGFLNRSVAAALRQSPSVPGFDPSAEGQSEGVAQIPKHANEGFNWFAAGEAPPAPAVAGESPSLREELLELAPLGQWRQKYIIAQGPRGLYLIDQHAAHERVYFEAFRHASADATASQPLLIPYAYHVPPGLWAAWREQGDGLRQWGFDIDEIGGTSLMIRAVPHQLADIDLGATLFQRVLEGLDPDAVPREHPWSWARADRMAMAACKAAIKAYRRLSLTEIGSLLEQLARTEDPRSCPHGRPTMLHWTIEEVDRRFGRSG